MTLEKFQNHMITLSNGCYVRWWNQFRSDPWTMGFRAILFDGTEAPLDETSLIAHGYHKEDFGENCTFWTIERTFEDGSRYIPRGFADNG